jgi:hypothetical protein
MNSEELSCLITYLEGRLNFAKKLIDDAQLTKNYGKEMHFIAQLEVYQDILKKLRAE